MDVASHLLPSLDLFVAPNSWGIIEPASILTDERGLSNDERARHRGALCVVFNGDVVVDVIVISPEPCQSYTSK